MNHAVIGVLLLTAVGGLLWSSRASKSPLEKGGVDMPQSGEVRQVENTNNAITINNEKPMNVDQVKPTTVKGAIISTTLGDIEIVLSENTAPKTAANFVSLVATKFYDGIKFHRVISGFMIQVGDPLTKDDSMQARWGTGGPGYKFDDELSGKEQYPYGTVAMANSGPNTNGSQFFIVTGKPNVSLPPAYTVFGKVVSGMDVAEKIQNVPRDSRDKPLSPIVIKSVTLK